MIMKKMTRHLPFSSKKKSYYIWTGIVLILLSIPVTFLFKGYVEEIQQGFLQTWEESQEELKQTQQVFIDQKIRLEQQAEAIGAPFKETVVVPFEKGMSQRTQAAEITAEKVAQELSSNDSV